MGRMPASLLLAAVCVVGVGWRRAGVHDAQLADPGGHRPVSSPLSVGGELYSSAVQRFVVAPNEQTRETPYIQHNIDATRRAFGLDGVEERELSGDALLTAADISPQCRHARQRPGCGITSRCSRRSGRSGDPHLLRVRLGGQRPLPGGRPPAGR
jgi:hypothetical protein